MLIFMEPGRRAGLTTAVIRKFFRFGRVTVPKTALRPELVLARFRVTSVSALRDKSWATGFFKSNDSNESWVSRHFGRTVAFVASKSTISGVWRRFPKPRHNRSSWRRPNTIWKNLGFVRLTRVASLMARLLISSCCCRKLVKKFPGLLGRLSANVFQLSSCRASWFHCLLTRRH